MLSMRQRYMTDAIKECALSLSQSEPAGLFLLRDVIIACIHCNSMLLSSQTNESDAYHRLFR